MNFACFVNHKREGFSIYEYKGVLLFPRSGCNLFPRNGIREVSEDKIIQSIKLKHGLASKNMRAYKKLVRKYQNQDDLNND